MKFWRRVEVHLFQPPRFLTCKVCLAVRAGPLLFCVKPPACSRRFMTCADLSFCRLPQQALLKSWLHWSTSLLTASWTSKRSTQRMPTSWWMQSLLSLASLELWHCKSLWRSSCRQRLLRLASMNFWAYLPHALWTTLTWARSNFVSPVARNGQERPKTTYLPFWAPSSQSSLPRWGFELWVRVQIYIVQYSTVHSSHCNDVMLHCSNNCLIILNYQAINM